ncbi:matrilin-3-like [Montipora capricornis]|uniref:matrilin-3-like n=1 Tax=Montipora capricornis TaxID=246305 RepID=UPI0035F1B72C
MNTSLFSTMAFGWILALVTLSFSGMVGSTDMICPASETCTEWLPVSECTKTCSGGTKKVSRTCTATMKCNEQPCELPCNAGLDIAILLDQSNSMLVDPSDMPMAIGFLKDLVSNFNPGEDLDHFGLITFKTDVEVEFNFADSKYYNIDKLKERISKEINFTPDERDPVTRTDLALKKARDELFTVAGGDRADKPNVMVVLTDGKPNPMRDFQEIRAQVTKDLKAKKVVTLAVGAGRDIDHDTLQLIAGPGNPVFHVQRFSQLKNRIDDIKSTICPEPEK